MQRGMGSESRSVEGRVVSAARKRSQGRGIGKQAAQLRLGDIRCRERAAKPRNKPVGVRPMSCALKLRSNRRRPIEGTKFQGVKRRKQTHASRDSRNKQCMRLVLAPLSEQSGPLSHQRLRDESYGVVLCQAKIDKAQSLTLLVKIHIQCARISAIYWWKQRTLQFCVWCVFNC